MRSIAHGFYPNALHHVALPGELKKQVCIVMRTKDRPILLVRALASVLAQKHSDWHLYLVNDGGDHAQLDALLAGYLPAFGARITIIQIAASIGMEAASNAALREMRGDFLAVHDDDDAWHPEFLQETVSYLGEPANSHYCAVVTQVETVWEQIVEDRVVELGREPYPIWQPEVDLVHLLNRNWFPPIALLARMQAVREVGHFNEALPVLGDWDYHWRLLMTGDIGTLARPLAHYHHRRHAQGVYANTVLTAVEKHLRHDVLYRNAAIRSFLKESPGGFGLMHGLLRRMDNDLALHRQQFGWAHDRHVDLQGRMAKLMADIDNLQAGLARQDASIERLHASIESALQIPRRIWRRLLPLRAWVARLRGRRPQGA